MKNISLEFFMVGILCCLQWYRLKKKIFCTKKTALLEDKAGCSKCSVCSTVCPKSIDDEKLLYSVIDTSRIVIRKNIK